MFLVLQPDMFPPEKQPLLLNTHNTLQTSGRSSLTLSDEPLWIPYSIKDDTPYPIDSSGKELHGFKCGSMHPGQKLSVFPLLINANRKLQAAKEQADNSPFLQFHCDLVYIAVDSIFYTPPELGK